MHTKAQSETKKAENMRNPTDINPHVLSRPRVGPTTAHNRPSRFRLAGGEALFITGLATMSNLTTMGLLLTMLSVGGSIQQLGGAHSLGSYGSLVSLIGVITGANLIFLGVKMSGSPAAVTLGAMASIATTYLRHNISMGLVDLLWDEGFGAMPINSTTTKPHFSLVC
uniref:Uncharacterized protein n=1 Tax=Oryza glumipatula TaxID=40148 RepID=A0A0E0ARN9_9ORYZ